MKLETENVEETEASAELVRELMADDARRGNWLILMHDDDDRCTTASVRFCDLRRRMRSSTTLTE